MEDIRFITGGVTAAKGFTANGVLAHFKATRKTPDLALIKSDTKCEVAGLFTQNRVKAECVKLTKERVKNGTAQAIIANSGNANCCTGEAGATVAKKMAQLAAAELGLDENDVLVCSTGVIGQQLPLDKVESNIKPLTAGLSRDGHTQSSQAVMTTDTVAKECAVETQIAGKTVRLGAQCKGSGMIHINLGTMLCFVTSDCAISSKMLQAALNDVAPDTLNQVSIDGDTSTNDTLLILSNGEAGNAKITSAGEDFNTFKRALRALLTALSLKLAGDGEGASRLVLCKVSGCKSVAIARVISKAVIKSNLVKAAMYGADANCGRVLCAMGYTSQDFTPEDTSVTFCAPDVDTRFFNEETPLGAAIVSSIIGDATGDEVATFNSNFFGANSIEVIHEGTGLKFDEDLAKNILKRPIVLIDIVLKDGGATSWAYGCDLTYDYVKINGDYRT